MSCRVLDSSKSLILLVFVWAEGQGDVLGSLKTPVVAGLGFVLAVPDLVLLLHHKFILNVVEETILRLATTSGMIK